MLASPNHPNVIIKRFDCHCALSKSCRNETASKAGTSSNWPSTETRQRTLFTRNGTTLWQQRGMLPLRAAIPVENGAGLAPKGVLWTRGMPRHGDFTKFGKIMEIPHPL